MRKYLLAAFLMLCASITHAFPLAVQYRSSLDVEALNYSSPTNACSAAVALYKKKMGLTAVYSSYTTNPGAQNGNCIGNVSGPNGPIASNYAYASWLTVPGSCPLNSVQVGQTCVCNTDHEPQQNGGIYSCEPPTDNWCENNAPLWNSTLNDDRTLRPRGKLSQYSQGSVVCHPSGKPDGGGCKMWFTGEYSFCENCTAEFDAPGEIWHTEGQGIALSSKDDPRAKGDLSCSVKDPADPGQDPVAEQPKPEERGCYKGTVNGKEVCVEAWTGQTEGVDFGITKGPDGTTTNTTNEIKCNGDQCTIKETNTIKDADGKTIKTTTSTTEGVNRGAYCAKNPRSSVCGGETDPSGGSKGQGGSGGGGGKGNGNGGDSGELDGNYTEIGAPKLYEKKYENGIKGVWDKHSAEFKNTPISGLAAKLFPNYGDGGSAPTYIIDLNLGGKWNLGSYDLNFDPRVWLALKAFTILCALALARKLVFGG